MGNDTLLLELYDTRLAENGDFIKLEAAKKSVSDLPDHDLGKHWYDYMKLPVSLSKRGKKLSERYEALLAQYLDAYLELLANAPACSPEQKKAKTAEYVNGLFDNGGPSTDQFVKMIGRDKAKELFEKFIFSSK